MTPTEEETQFLLSKTRANYQKSERLLKKTEAHRKLAIIERKAARLEKSLYADLIKHHKDSRKTFFKMATFIICIQFALIFEVIL